MDVRIELLITYIKNFAVWHSYNHGIVERMPNRENCLRHRDLYLKCMVLIVPLFETFTVPADGADAPL